MQNKTFFKLLSLYLVVALFLLTLPSQGWTMYLRVDQVSSSRQADLGAIQNALESAVVKQRLLDFGLSSEEALARINSLSDEQTHKLAENLDALQAGADGGIGAVVFLLLVVIIVVIVLQATGHSIVIRK